MKKNKIIILLIMTLLLTGCSIFDDNNNNTNTNTNNNNSNTTEPTPTNKETKPGESNNTEYEIGSEVTVKGEPFYVLEKSEASDTTIVLFAKYNLKKDGTKQYPNASFEETKVEFSSEEYWIEAAKAYTDWDNKKFDLNTINGNKSGDVITKARDYGKSLGGTGRLITYEEVDKLRYDYPVMIGGHDNQPQETGEKYLNYYTSSVRPFNIYKVYMVRGHETPTLEVDSALYGVRPVIEISKSLID